MLRHIWILLCLSFQRRPRNPEKPRMSEEELIAALAVPEDNQQLRAVFQLSDDLEDEAIDGAAKMVAQHGMCASAIGGAEHLRILRDRLRAYQAGRPVDNIHRAGRGISE